MKNVHKLRSVAKVCFFLLLLSSVVSRDSPWGKSVVTDFLYLQMKITKHHSARRMINVINLSVYGNWIILAYKLTFAKHDVLSKIITFIKCFPKFVLVFREDLFFFQ